MIQFENPQMLLIGILILFLYLGMLYSGEKYFIPRCKKIYAKIHPDTRFHRIKFSIGARIFAIGWSFLFVGYILLLLIIAYTGDVDNSTKILFALSTIISLPTICIGTLIILF